MVSFSCEVCNDTIIKKKLGQHKMRCYDAYFTCIDCNTTFVNNDHDKHTSCITEAQKYEKALYKPKKGKKEVKEVKEVEEVKKVEEVKEEKKEKKEKKETPVSQITSLLKVDKPTNFKKLIKSLTKDQQKELIKQLKITKNSDDSVSLNF